MCETPSKARRDAKRAKKAEKEAKFLARMEEKKASGEWVEKTKWKAMERKAALEKKNVNENDSDEESEKRPKKVRKRQQKKKKPQKAVENAPPAAKRAKVEAWLFCINLNLTVILPGIWLFRMDNTLQSIENLPSENDENEPLLEFRFQARNMSVDWRKLSLIDVDAIAGSMDIDQLQARFGVLIVAIEIICEPKYRII